MRPGIFTYERNWRVDGSSAWNIESDNRYTCTQKYSNTRYKITGNIVEHWVVMEYITKRYEKRKLLKYETE